MPYHLSQCTTPGEDGPDELHEGAAPEPVGVLHGAPHGGLHLGGEGAQPGDVQAGDLGGGGQVGGGGGGGQAGRLLQPSVGWSPERR